MWGNKFPGRPEVMGGGVSQETGPMVFFALIIALK